MSEQRPVIGISAVLETATVGLWKEPSALIQMNYVEAVQRAGGMALIIPYDPILISRPDEILDRIDGLLLAGGSDVDPGSYAAAPHPKTTGTVPERDAIEIALARRAMERDLPVLGICRGMQVLNVARGGTLIQDIPELVGHEEHRRNLGTFAGNDHQVSLAAGSLAARAAGGERETAFSHHHQAIDRLGSGFVITGHSALDDLPEAIEAPENSYVLGVQWHPEADQQSRVIGSLVDSARISLANRLV